MSISFSGSTLTFSDSTTMTTAAVAGPPGPTGSTGPTGPTGPTGSAGSNASVVTTYGAVGSYVFAYYAAACNNTAITPSYTVCGGSLKRNLASNMCCQGGGINGFYYGNCGNGIHGKTTGITNDLSLSGTWRSQAYGLNKYGGGWYYLNHWLRIS